MPAAKVKTAAQALEELEAPKNKGGGTKKNFARPRPEKERTRPVLVKINPKRPPAYLSDQFCAQYTDEEIIEALRVNAAIVSAAATALGVSPSSLTKRLKHSPTLSVEIQTIKEECLDIAESKLWNLIQDGDRESVKFYLRCHGKHRGWVDTLKVDHTHQHQHTHRIGPDLSRLTEAELLQMRAMLEDAETRTIDGEVIDVTPGEASG